MTELSVSVSGANGPVPHVVLPDAPPIVTYYSDTFRCHEGDGAMNPTELSDFAARYQPMLRQVDFELRADRLIWAGKYNDANALISYLPAGSRPVIQTRIALETQAGNAQSLLSQLSSEQTNDLGLLYLTDSPKDAVDFIVKTSALDFKGYDI